MTPNQQKSFFSGNGYEQNEGHYNRGAGIRYTDRDLTASGAAIVWVLRKVVRGVEKLIVLVKYQFYKHTAVAPSSVRLPWVRLCVVGMLGFMAMRQELSFSIGMGDSHHARFGNPGLAEEVSLKEKVDTGGVFDLFTEKKVDHFADLPTDDAKTRQVKAYIRRFKDVALREKERFGIPASVKMAQAIVESNSGGSRLATENNNHFGVKCFSRTCKKGHCSNFGDDSHKDFFRKYDSPWESWRAHSEMIAEGRYKSLLKHGDDYRKWARGLKKLGYATASHYEDTLINTIEKYHLYDLDK